ncbi:MAG: methyltransferase domain-containing protein [Pseudonocardiaceae bacterium]
MASTQEADSVKSAKIGWIPAQGLSGRMRETWARGDFHRLGVEQLIVGERLCEEVDVRAGDRVLDIACGAGNTTLAAARRRARCTGCDFVPALLERAELRASAEGLAIEWVEADAHALPFDDGSFDKVLSTFGVMFAVDQRAADELLRVLHPGGTLGLSCWTPASAIGDIYRLNARFIAPPPDLRPPTQWASGPRLRELFGDRVSALRLTEQVWRTRFASFSDWLELYRTWYGPTNTTFASLDEQQQTEYTAGLEEIVNRHNRATDGTILAAYEYVNIVGVRAR